MQTQKILLFQLHIRKLFQLILLNVLLPNKILSDGLKDCHVEEKFHSPQHLLAFSQELLIKQEWVGLVILQ
jgi:hypothetical protein